MKRACGITAADIMDRMICSDPQEAARIRDSVIVRTSVIGILTNILLASFKAVVGILSNSIAITMDALNNLSDVLSSVITIVGTKLAGKRPDREHPMGHGRGEYLTAMAVSSVIFYAGVAAAIESLKKIADPSLPEYDNLTLSVVAVSVIVKIFLGTFVKRQGLKVVSQSLVASGKDALYDAVISVSVLISAVIFLTSGICLEAYVALFISLYIVKAGIEMMLETLNHLLGARADSKKTAQIKQILTSDPNVRGAYDLILYNFGPDKDYASVHLELPDIMKVKDVDCLTRKLETEVYRQTGVVLAGVGVYSYNTENSEIAVIQNDVRKKVIAHDWAIQFHGFYVDLAAKEMRFDVVMNFDIDHQDGLKIIYDEISSAYPDFHIEISPDVDISVSD